MCRYGKGLRGNELVSPAYHYDTSDTAMFTTFTNPEFKAIKDKIPHGCWQAIRLSQQTNRTSVSNLTVKVREKHHRLRLRKVNEVKTGKGRWSLEY
jgi:hypothetical protein